MIGSSYLPKLLWRHLLLYLLLLLLFAGCVMPEALVVQLRQSTAEAIDPHLQSALAHTPADVTLFAFTNWERIKQIGGVPDLTSADPIEERFGFVLPLAVDEQALASLFAANHFRTHAEQWGWDSTDLLWEANLTTEGPPIYLLRFREDFDFAPVLDRLDKRGYTSEERAGATFFSHAMDLSADWLHTTEFSILNIALLAEEKLFVLSSSPDTVTSVLEAIAEGSTLLQRPDVAAGAAALGEVGAALISPLGCQPFDVASMLGASPELLEELMDEMHASGISGLYTVFALGYRVATRDGQSTPLGVLVHFYPSAEQASADLEPRRHVAQTATSLASNQPYAELFEVVDAEVVETSTGGANLILSLRAHDRPPQLFFNMFNQRDLLFSACGGS